MATTTNQIIIHEDAARICGTILESEETDYTISGTVDDLCLRDFIICTLIQDTVTKPSNKSLYAYVARPGVEKSRPKQSMLTTIAVLEKVANRSKHFPKLISYGYTPKMVYGQDDIQEPEYDPRVHKRPVLIIEHEHTLLSVLLSFSPYRCLPIQFALRVGLGMVRALAALHRAGFVHRLVMPHSFGYPTGCALKGFEEDLIIIDLSLCMPYPALPRIYAPFVGTARYSSLTTHKNKEQAPPDDIISVIYIVAEFISGRLPWSYLNTNQTKLIVQKKRDFTNTDIFKRLPHELRDLYTETMENTARILDYNKVLSSFKGAIRRLDPNNNYCLPHWLEHPKNMAK